MTAADLHAYMLDLLEERVRLAQEVAALHRKLMEREAE